MGIWSGTLEELVSGSLPSASAWAGRSVLVTGHTGFKGSWLTAWLAGMGARVHGLSLDPPTVPNMFNEADIASHLMSDTRGDVVDLSSVEQCLSNTQPSVIFHLAAQSLVRKSYADPLDTVRTNVLGTATLLDAVRRAPSVEVVVVVTTDKVYKNFEWLYPYRENDELGGRDLYSSSKASAELITSAYRSAFFENRNLSVATVRAGNVIGGGDWSADRLVPDLLRCIDKGVQPELRYPGAVRPWQHVLEPLCGYLLLAERLLTRDGATPWPDSWNFGPKASDFLTVEELAAQILRSEGLDLAEVVNGQPDLKEASLLTLDSSLARSLLGWEPRWDVQMAILATLTWHDSWRSGADLRLLTQRQISDYCASGGAA